MTALTAKQQAFIDMMKESDELAWEGFQRLVNEREDHPRFFEALQSAGFFAPTKNPAPAPGERENTIRIPFWPSLVYLKSLAERAGAERDGELGAKIMNVVRDVSSWRDENGQPRHNYHTNHAFTEILGLLQTDVIQIGDIDLLRQWIDDPYERMLVASALKERLLPRLLNSARPEDWAKAARVLFHVTAMTWSRGDGDEREPTPIAFVDDFWLGEILKGYARQIGAKAGAKAVEIMLERVREAYDTPLRRSNSSVFRPAVEDNSQNHEWRSAENRMVEGFRDVLLGWTEAYPARARAVVEHMLKDDLQIVRRIALYILAQHWESFRDLYSEIVSPGLFADGQNHELYHLLQDRFADMTLEQQKETVRAIEELAAPAYGDDPERMRRQSQYRWLSAISGKGHAPADKLFAELNADQDAGRLGEHPDFETYIYSWVGPGPSPYSPEELTSLAEASKLVEKLNEFTPRFEWRSPTSEGLASALTAAARTNPSIFLDGLSQFLSAKPVHQNAVIIGLKGAWEAKTDVNWDRGWEQLVTFFEQLSKNHDFWRERDDTRRDGLVRAIADALHAGTKDDERAYDASLLPRTQRVIAFLLQHEPGAETAGEDPMMQALNTAKGRVIEALFSQALRAARVSHQQHGTHEEAWKAISPVFEAELSECRDRNFEFSTLCGTYLPQLQYLDAGWVGERIAQIFPTKYESNTICAFDGLAYAAFTRAVYDLIAAHGIIDRGLDLELRGRGAREKLIERIGAAYLWGVEELDGAHFTNFFEKAAPEDLDTLTRVLWMVRKEKVTRDQRERILAFWDRTLMWAGRQAQTPTRLLSSLSLLATYITAIGFREQRLLEAVAAHVHVGHEVYEFTAELLRLAPQNPEAIANILKSMVEAHPPDYDYQNRLRSLLELLAAQGQRTRVILISERLRHLPGVEALYNNLTRPQVSR